MKVSFGGDYNPEQWGRDVWEEDYRLFDEAGIDTVTLGVFAWAHTQPAPDVYDFATLDAIVARAVAGGRRICLATGTGAHPPWLARRYPEVCRTDFEGRRHRFGQRHNSCPSSPVFRRLSAELARRVARRYAGHRLSTVEFGASLVFELVIPQGAEVVGTYTADFYAGTAAVTRHAFGAGSGWYVGAGLDTGGVAWVIRRVLAEQGLSGPYPDVPDLETTTRVAPDGTRLRFLLNHRAEPVEVPAPAGGLDLLTGGRIRTGQPIRLDPRDVAVIAEEA